MDPTFIGHVFRRPTIYQKPWQTRAYISAAVGESLLSSEGGKHHRQRRIADQAFSERNLRTFLSVMFVRSAQLTEKWISIVGKSDDEKAVIEVCHWAQRCTLVGPHFTTSTHLTATDYKPRISLARWHLALI
jgi:cytochrome P450